MQGFVQGRSRGASPHGAEHRPPGVNAKRLASGAIAKVSTTRKAGLSQPPVPSSIPTRGLGNVTNAPVVIQQHPPQHRLATHSQEKKHDPYDTDAESLDTTVNLSVAGANDSQEREQKRQQHPDVVALVDAEDDDEDEFAEEIDFDGSELTSEDIILAKDNLQHLSHEVQLSFLQQVQQGHFPTMEGDSYPSTTDGNPTEWEGGLEPPSTNMDDDEGTATAPKHQAKNDQLHRSFLARSLQGGPPSNQVRPDQVPHSQSDFSQPLVTHRNQQLFSRHPQPGRIIHQETTKAPPTSQPPTYSQANVNAAPTVSVHASHRPSIAREPHRPPQPSHRQQVDPTRTHVRASETREPPISSKIIQPISTQAVPSLQRNLAAEMQPKESTATLDGDYDKETLFKMSYGQLKQETFDYDPCAGPQVLPDDILKKPLVERLEFVQKKFDAGKHSEFFSSLSTSEWEEAGDWFLDQFQNIIQRARDARRKKRKLAQDFENEVEERQTHVMKKQRQVEEAMNKMKKQGEGLVAAKSPRPSKSPKPKRV